VAGFGAALLAMPVLTFAVGVRAAAPLVALLTLVINVSLLAPVRRQLPWRRVAPLFAGSLFGIPLGVRFLAAADEQLVRTALGALLVATSLGLFRFGRLPLGGGVRPALLTGGVAGVLGGAFNTAGPPVLVYAAAQPWSKAETHAVLQLFFFGSGLVVATSHALAGLTNRGVLLAALAALPFLAAGSLAGHAVHRRISEERFRTLVRAALLVAGFALLVVRGGR
jgi:uncharacterized membrane protein YfcA